MDVAAWLRDLGLAQYEQKFRDHDIHVAVAAGLLSTHAVRTEALPVPARQT